MAVSQTVWEDGHTTWTLRCRKCSRQAQMDETRYRSLVDVLLTGVHQEIPLGVLCAMIAP